MFCVIQFEKGIKAVISNIILNLQDGSYYIKISWSYYFIENLKFDVDSNR